MRKRNAGRPGMIRLLALSGLLFATAAVATTGLAGLRSAPGPALEKVRSPTRPAPASDAPGGTVRAEGESRSDRVSNPTPRIHWRDSVAVGTHSAGRLERGVLLPAEGRGWFTWDPILRREPNRPWRRWGSDRLVRATLTVLGRFRQANPGAPRVAVGDLSRPRGGDFGPRFGSIGHASHQNGLDVDVYYPRRDRRLRPPDSPGQVNLKLAQELVDLFVAAGAEQVFVGPALDLTGPAGIVVPLVNHDNHLHARFPLDR